MQKDASRFASLYEGVVTKVFDRLLDETWVYRGTARTPRSAPSGRTWRSGASAAG